MQQLFALLSIVFMMSFVMMFERVHHGRLNTRFWKNGLLSSNDVQRIVSILSACQDG
jgi:hypothetical protein